MRVNLWYQVVLYLKEWQSRNGIIKVVTMGKTIEEYKKELESQITSFKNIHYALNSGSWHLEYDRHYHLTMVQWSDTLRQMLGFVSEADFPNTFEAWSSRLHPEDKAFSIHE